jgi:hypothetical protein
LGGAEYFVDFFLAKNAIAHGLSSEDFRLFFSAGLLRSRFAD